MNKIKFVYYYTECSFVFLCKPPPLFANSGASLNADGSAFPFRCSLEIQSNACLPSQFPVFRLTPSFANEAMTAIFWANRIQARAEGNLDRVTRRATYFYTRMISYRLSSTCQVWFRFISIPLFPRAIRLAPRKIKHDVRAFCRHLVDL